MTIKIYVDYTNEEVLSEKQYEEMIAKKVENAYEDDCPDCYNFDEWLEEEDYCASELFRMSEAEKDEVVRRFKEYADATIRSESDFREETLKI